ncbi:hypothetical protein BGX29_000501 [Mortierella sp. GBA35]|nr:hypothetical protein BGX29_000501 [Mortierella sp. GBA35]
MRFISAIVAASMVAIVNAQHVSFPFAPERPCVAACTASVGKSLFPLYDDVNVDGPFFLPSLSFIFEHGTANTAAFTIKTSTCMLSCPLYEQDLYKAQYPFKQTWYNNHRSA